MKNEPYYLAQYSASQNAFHIGYVRDVQSDCARWMRGDFSDWNTLGVFRTYEEASDLIAHLRAHRDQMIARNN